VTMLALKRVTCQQWIRPLSGNRVLRLTVPEPALVITCAFTQPEQTGHTGNFSHSRARGGGWVPRPRFPRRAATAVRARCVRGVSWCCPRRSGWRAVGSWNRVSRRPVADPGRGWVRAAMSSHVQRSADSGARPKVALLSGLSASPSEPDARGMEFAVFMTLHGLAILLIAVALDRGRPDAAGRPVEGHRSQSDLQAQARDPRTRRP
jgi:hypothetical protein